MSLKAGQTFSHYRLVEKIGEGGMGVVWKAFDSKLDREVAIKILPATVARDPARLERFTREAKAVAALNHPNIVTIHNIEEAGGDSFLVMELIEGQSLDRTIPADGLALSCVLEIAAPIAVALAAAHEKGIVHRDVKPGNIMITTDGRVKVLDFGLAKLAQELGSDGEDAAAPTRTAPLTGAGAIVGTAPYMSPEQLHGQPVDSRSDIFSLGIVLYEMVTGKRPFQGVSGIDLASSILKDTPRPVSDLRGELPRHLGRVIHQCLEKSPDQRFQTMTDVRNQLEIVRRETTADSTPAFTPPPVVTTRTGAPWAKRIAVLALGILLAVAAGYAVRRAWLSPADTPPAVTTAVAEAQTPTILVLPFENLGSPEDEYFADGMTEEITSRLAVLDGLAVVSRTTAMQYKEARPSLREIGEELGVDYVLEGTVRWQRSEDGASRVRVTPQLIRVPEDTHLWADRYDRVLEDIFDVQSDIARKVSEALGIALLEPQLASLASAPTENLEAYDYFLRGNDYFDRGMGLISEEAVNFAIRMYEDAVRLDPSFALAHARLSRAYMWYLEGDTPSRGSSESWISKARGAADRASELDPDLSETRLALGNLHFYGDRDIDAAYRELRLALQSEPNNAEIHEAISTLQADQGLWEDARASMLKAVELNPRLGRLSCWLGGIDIQRRNYREALRAHDRAIRLTPDRACPYWCKTWIYLIRDGDSHEARTVLEGLPPTLDLEQSPAMAYPWIRVDMMDGRYDHAFELLAQGSLTAYEFGEYYIPKVMLEAQILELTGRTAESRKRYEEAREILEARIREYPEDHRPHGALGIVYASLGRADDAIRMGERGLELLGGSKGISLAYRVKDMAQIRLILGDRERALGRLDELLSRPGFFSIEYLAADPTFAALHDDPAFRALVDRHGRRTG